MTNDLGLDRAPAEFQKLVFLKPPTGMCTSLLLLFILLFLFQEIRSDSNWDVYSQRKGRGCSTSGLSTSGTYIYPRLILILLFSIPFATGLSTSITSTYIFNTFIASLSTSGTYTHLLLLLLLLFSTLFPLVSVPAVLKLLSTMLQVPLVLILLL